MPVSAELAREIETFLYTEAHLLEENRFDDWLACLTDDVRYWMPVRENVLNVESNPEDRFALFEEDKPSLTLRVLRIKTGDAHAEVPPSVTSRQITNVLVTPVAGEKDLFEVRSTFSIYQERRSQHFVTFHGRRVDRLRRVDGAFKIAARRIELAQAIMPTTISIFF